MRVEDMPVFQLFYSLALDVEKTSRGYPRDFGWLRGQKLRSSESVCANMTEGFYAQYSTSIFKVCFDAGGRLEKHKLICAMRRMSLFFRAMSVKDCWQATRMECNS